MSKDPIAIPVDELRASCKLSIDEVCFGSAGTGGRLVAS